jgi:hypothetical protein
MTYILGLITLPALLALYVAYGYVRLRFFGDPLNKNHDPE